MRSASDRDAIHVVAAFAHFFVLTVCLLSVRAMGGILSRFKSAPPPPPPGAVVIADDATKVDLSSRGIRVVPTEICQLKHLQSLSLGFNKLTTLDPQIAQLATLTKLTLSGNQLKALPAEIGQLTNLREVCAASVRPRPRRLRRRLPLVVQRLPFCRPISPRDACGDGSDATRSSWRLAAVNDIAHAAAHS